VDDALVPQMLFTHLDIKQLLSQVFVNLEYLVALLSLVEVLRVKACLVKLLLDSKGYLIELTRWALPTIFQTLDFFLVLLNLLLVLLILGMVDESLGEGCVVEFVRWLGFHC